MGLLGIEISRDGAAAVVYDIEGRQLGVGRGPYQPDCPEPGQTEIRMDRVWDGLRQAVGQAVAGAGEAVTAMSLAVLGQAAVPIDGNGRALAPSVLPEDVRTEELARDFQEKVSPIEVMRFTGMPAGHTYTVLKLLWLKQNAPEVYANTWKFMGWQDYVVGRLGLEPTTDASLAGRTQMFDIINREWADGIIDQAGLDRDKLSEVGAAGTVLGEISRKAADELGLPAGTKFVLGGLDSAVAALSVGAASSGHAMNATEGVEYLVSAFHEPVVDVGMMKNAFSCCPHVVPDMYVSVACNFTGTSLLRWYREVLGQEEERIAKESGRDVYEVITERMDDEPTSLMVLPYFTASGTPYMDPRPMGSIVGLTLQTGRGTLIRGLLEGLAFEMKLNMELLAESGIRLNEVHVTGPAARSRKWCQLKSEIFGLPVRRHLDTDAATLGAAMLAGIGVGIYENAATAVEFCVNPEEEVLPSGDRSDIYAGTFSRYRRLYPALCELMP